MELVVGEVVGMTKWVHVQRSLGKEKVITHRVSVGSAGKHKNEKDSFSRSIALKLSGSMFA